MFHSSPDTSVDVETVQTLNRGAFSSTDIPKSLKKYPDSSSTSPETIVELEKQTSEIRTSYRTVSVALFEFGDKLLALKEKVKKARLKWSDWLQYHFPDTNKQTKDAMAIARICRQLRDTECHLVEKMRGWGTPVIAVLCRGGIELVKKFLSENDNPVGWTVKAVKTFVQQWKQPNGCNSKRKQSTRSVAPKSAKPNFEPAPGSTTNRRLILELARLRKLKATLNEELDVSVTKEVRDKLKQDILHADIKIERARELLIESSTPAATSNHQPETDAAESQLESSVQIEEQLRQENTSLKAKLEQLETQQHFNSNWLAVPIWWLGQTDLLLGNTLSSDRPQSMNATYWYNEWFEPVESQAKNHTDCPVEHEISSGQSSEVIDLNDQTSIHSIPVVQEVVKGKRRPRKTTTSPHQFTLFNLDDF